MYAIYAVNNVNVHVKYVKDTKKCSNICLPQYCFTASITEVCTVYCVAHFLHTAGFQEKSDRKSNGGLCPSRALGLATPLLYTIDIWTAVCVFEH